MKLFQKDEFGIFYLLLGDNYYIQFINQWKQFVNFGRYNWINFSIIHLEFEYEKMFWNNFNANISLLGLSLYIQYAVPTQEQKDRMELMDRDMDREMKASDAMESLARRLAASGELQRGMVLEAEEIVEVLDARERAGKKKLIDMTNGGLEELLDETS